MLQPAFTFSLFTRVFFFELTEYQVRMNIMLIGQTGLPAWKLGILQNQYTKKSLQCLPTYLHALALLAFNTWASPPVEKLQAPHESLLNTAHIWRGTLVKEAKNMEPCKKALEEHDSDITNEMDEKDIGLEHLRRDYRKGKNIRLRS